MIFQLTLLGTNSALPAHGRFPTAQVLNVQESYYLIDCGEGTQIQMNKYPVKRSKINHIFISHLHGDHVFGLVGLLTSYNLNGRTAPLDIFGPEGLKDLIRLQLKYSYSIINFPLTIHTIDPTKHHKIFENKILEVYSIPLKHRVPTSGFLFIEKQRAPNIKADQIKKYDLSVPQILAAKRGEDVALQDGTVIPNEVLVSPAPKPRSYAYCSDTMYYEPVIPIIQNADLLYHESTFLKSEQDKAAFTMHSTTTDAARIAKLGNVKKLILGHYSSRYRDIEVFREEATEIFPHTIAGIEGMQIDVPFEARSI
ncbi:MAG: ribonuclease Z [Bacteroidota bacterium]